MRLRSRPPPLGFYLSITLASVAAFLFLLRLFGLPISLLPIALLLLASAFGLLIYVFPGGREQTADDTAEREERAFKEAVRAFEKAAPSIPKGEGMFQVPISQFMNVPRTLSAMMQPIYKGPPSNLRRQLDINRLQLSGRDGKEIWPEKFEGTANEAIDAYLKDTPLRSLFNRSVPIGFDDATRFRHAFFCAPTGVGKTNLLLQFLERDFERVERGECSVVLIDSTGDLLPNLTRLARFAPVNGESRLVLADVNDVHYPLALSLFDFGLANVSEYNRAAFRNTATSLISYIFRALLGMELTAHQTTALSFAIEVLIDVPGANLNDLIAFLKPGGAKKHQAVIDTMRPAVRAYFRDTFDSVEVQKRKTEVTARLDGITARAELSNTFASRQTRLDFFKEMNAGKVIIINIPRPLLGEEGVEIFGRYFIAMLLIAAERRVDIPEHKRLPCFLYIDECQNILHRDEKIAEMLDGVRKFRVGVTLLSQRTGHFEDNVLNAIIGNVATTFAARIADPAASRFARFMGTSADFITHQPQHHFAVHSPGIPKAISVPIPRATLTDQPRMSEEEYAELLAITRKRYATPLKELHSEDDDERAVLTPLVQEPVALQSDQPPAKSTPSPQRPTRW